MPVKGAAQNRVEEYIRMKAVQKHLRKNPKWINQKKGVLVVEYNGDKVDVQVLTEEEINKQEGADEMKPIKKALSIEEKLKILEELVGLSDRFSPEGVEETIRIANREYDQEDDNN
ncbi:hypothetical protein ABES02_13730 [Neobacillus pocheonensis]|uniref:hypothetical protein n=1 Tax=Neobacillus pocheonensis TaxID=363869 RepID=UPI003D28A90E